jgi:hypothetical protein
MVYYQIYVMRWNLAMGSGDDTQNQARILLIMLMCWLHGLLTEEQMVLIQAKRLIFNLRQHRTKILKRIRKGQSINMISAATSTKTATAKTTPTATSTGSETKSPQTTTVAATTTTVTSTGSDTKFPSEIKFRSTKKGIVKSSIRQKLQQIQRQLHQVCIIKKVNNHE